MTYYESAEGVMISKKRAVNELKRHGINDTEEFYKETGDKENYNAQSVLEWLGY